MPQSIVWICVSIESMVPGWSSECCFAQALKPHGSLDFLLSSSRLRPQAGRVHPGQNAIDLFSLVPSLTLLQPWLKSI